MGWRELGDFSRVFEEVLERGEVWVCVCVGGGGLWGISGVKVLVWVSGAIGEVGGSCDVVVEGWRSGGSGGWSGIGAVVGGGED